MMYQVVSHDVSSIVTNNQDWIAQTSIKFKSQLNLKYKLISCIHVFQVMLSVN